MASANKSIQSPRFPQRIPPDKSTQSDCSGFGALWILLYASTALILATTSIVVAVCVSISEPSRRDSDRAKEMIAGGNRGNR
jgi:hypothetical protein